MLKPSFRRLIAPILLLGSLLGGWAHAADPPSRVARLAYVSGGASFSPGGERDWGRAVVNRPMVTGDRLWVERGARAELQLGAAAIRVGGSTSLTLLNLDDRIAQVQLEEGTLNIRVRRLDRGQVFEVATPNLAYVIRKPGSYRIHVDEDGVTTVTVRAGQADVYGEGRAFVVRERQALRFHDAGLRRYQTFATWPTDEFDRWSNERDRRSDNSPSRRYVSSELIGYEDLDQHGTWRKHRDYGSVWVPNRVSADWAPYRDGHWAWVEPWGWTWVDEAPWGFAPSHYGRWAHVDGGWAWVPGPVKARAVYAPALVAFVAGSNLQQSGGGAAVGWFPLGPRDVYRPSYAASRQYFNNVNTSNTVITQASVGHVYDNRNAPQPVYANQQVQGAVVAVLAAAFAQSRPVARETFRVSRDVVTRAPVAVVAPVAPVQASVVGPAGTSGAKPPERSRRGPVVAQTAPPPPPVPFAARQGSLAANAGKPLDPAAVAALKPAAAASAPAVKVVAPTQPVAAPAMPASAPPAAAPPAAAPPAAAPPVAAASAARDGRGQRGERGDDAPGRRQPASAPARAAAPATPATPPTAPASRATPATPATPAAPAAVAPPPPAAASAARPARPGDDGRQPGEGRQRGRDAREAQPPQAQRSAAPPSPPASAPAADQRGRRNPPDEARAGRREAASGARNADEPRRKEDEGRKP